MKKVLSFLLPLLPVAFVSCPDTGFSRRRGGANTTGGRGGKVVYGTTLAPNGPGSLNEALHTPGKRYILFIAGCPAPNTDLYAYPVIPSTIHRKDHTIYLFISTIH